MPGKKKSAPPAPAPPVVPAPPAPTIEKKARKQTRMRSVPKSRNRMYFNRLCKESGLPSIDGDAMEVVEQIYQLINQNLISHTIALMGKKRSLTCRGALLGYTSYTTLGNASNEVRQGGIERANEALKCLQ